MAGLPLKTLGQLRNMSVEDEYLLAWFFGPGIALTERRLVSVVITRERDEYELSVEWQAHLGRNAHRRGQFWYVSRFKLRRGRRFEVLPNFSGDVQASLVGLRMAAVVSTPLGRSILGFSSIDATLRSGRCGG